MRPQAASSSWAQLMRAQSMPAASSARTTAGSSAASGGSVTRIPHAAVGSRRAEQVLRVPLQAGIPVSQLQRGRQADRARAWRLALETVEHVEDRVEIGEHVRLAAAQ